MSQPATAASATLKETAPCIKELQVEVPAEAVRAEFETVYRELKRKAQVPGFRPGTAPRDLLERYHGQKAREEVLQRLISRSIDEALSAQPALDLIGRPQVKEAKFQPDQSLAYTAELETAPQVPLGAYKGLKLTRPTAEVSDENLSKVLDHLRESRSQLKPVLEERPSAAGDFLVVDLTQKSPNAKQPPQKQKEVVIHLDLDRDPEGILKPLVGMKTAEVRTVTLKDGTTLTVEMKSLKAKESPALDDAFAKSVGPYETLKALKEAVRADLKAQAEASQRSALESQALQQLIEGWEFDVPPSLVGSQARRLLKERAMELMNQGLPQDQVQGRAQLLTDQAKVDALKQVKLFFILRKVAAAEKLTAAEEEVSGRIQALAQRLQISEEQVRDDLQARELLDELVWGIIRGKVLDLIIRESEIKEGTSDGRA